MTLKTSQSSDVGRGEADNRDKTTGKTDQIEFLKTDELKWVETEEEI